jgi:hypothetical protein
MEKAKKEKSPFSNLEHVAVVVRDVDKAIKRLRLLGIGPFKVPPPIPGDEGMFFRGKPLAEFPKVRFALVEDTGFELEQPGKGESPWQEFLESKNEGIHHLGFRFNLDDDIEGVVSNLTAKGAKVIFNCKMQGRLGAAYIDLGVGGIIVELFKSKNIHLINGGGDTKKSTVKSPILLKSLHVGIVVRDIDKAVKRLDSLGIGLFRAYVPPSTAPLIGIPTFRGKPMEAEVKVFKAKVGDVMIELFEPGKGESPWKEYLDKNGEGIHHIGFNVDDLDEAKAAFIKQGAKVLSTIEWQGGGGMYFDIGIGGLLLETDKR